MVDNPLIRKSDSLFDVNSGVAYAAVAYGLWGLFPLYFRAVASIPAVEVLCHRIVWSVAFLAIVLTLRHAWRRVVAVASDRRLLVRLLMSATLIAVNWGVFIWAVAHHRVLECSLGYFINPLVSVFLGVVVLNERLSPLQCLALFLAVLSVVIEIVLYGNLPWVALCLAISFGLYGLLRKMMRVDPLSGLFVEAVLLSPIALGYLVVVAAQGEGVFGRIDGATDALLVFAGPLTALPLILFVAGARRIRLITIGLLQYIAPTGHFLLAVLVFGEPFVGPTVAIFITIWLAVAIYAFDAIRAAPRPRHET